MALEPKPFAPNQTPKGLSEKALQIHHDTLYAGYVKKSNEIAEKLAEFASGAKPLDSANQSYSELRGLKEGETFSRNGVYLHEWYFDVLGGDGAPTGTLADALTEKFGSVEMFLAYFKACGMVARGWAVLAWDIKAQKLMIYTADAHNQGGVWGCVPVIVLDVYEHAYFMDYGSNRAGYIDDFFATLDWQKANELFEKVKTFTL